MVQGNWYDSLTTKLGVRSSNLFGYAILKSLDNFMIFTLHGSGQKWRGVTIGVTIAAINLCALPHCENITKWNRP
jgi:hypothetical protein